MKYVLIYLRKMSWTNSQGISGNTWAYTSNPKRNVKLFGTSNPASSFNMRKVGETASAKATEFVTIWLNELTDEEATLYQEQGIDTAYACVPSNVLDDIDVISVQDYKDIHSSKSSQQDSASLSA